MKVIGIQSIAPPSANGRGTASTGFSMKFRAEENATIFSLLYVIVMAVGLVWAGMYKHM
jgi:hypothetical protein